VHKFSHHHAERLEQPERYSLIPPAETLLRFGLRNGMTFADVGAGTGFFTRAAAEIVGADGAVFALDLSSEMIDILRDKGVQSNIQLLLSEEYLFPLDEHCADMTLLAFVVHETPDIPRFIHEALRITKPGGTIVILEWKKQTEEHGPEKEERLAVDDLLSFLSGYSVRSGNMNASHYFVTIAA
jgi:ubiquinone/menaquinone biosynthesis C-methylase UbiE